MNWNGLILTVAAGPGIMLLCYYSIELDSKTDQNVW